MFRPNAKVSILPSSDNLSLWSPPTVTNLNAWLAFFGPSSKCLSYIIRDLRAQYSQFKSYRRFYLDSKADERRWAGHIQWAGPDGVCPNQRLFNDCHSVITLSGRYPYTAPCSVFTTYLENVFTSSVQLCFDPPGVSASYPSLSPPFFTTKLSCSDSNTPVDPYKAEISRTHVLIISMLSCLCMLNILLWWYSL